MSSIQWKILCLSLSLLYFCKFPKVVFNNHVYSIILPSLTSCQLPTVNHHTILFTHCQLSPISVTLLSIIPPLLIVFLTLSRCLLLQARWLRNHHGWWENLVWRNQDTTLESSCLSSHSLQVEKYLILYFFISLLFYLQD